MAALPLRAQDDVKFNLATTEAEFQKFSRVVAQGILFGASHGYQGWRSMAVIAIFGCAFGILAAWRKNLRPGMMAHAWQDLFTGLVLKMLMKFAP